jgi:GT2 family glycosyltransferase
MRTGDLGIGQEFLVSIIIPTYNRPHHLAACLESLIALRFPPGRVEVIVVDDGGSTPLEAVVAPYRSRLQVTLLRQEHAGQATARNAGAAQARGEFLAFIDDDCRPAADWLEALARRLEAVPGAVVGGRMRNALPDNVYSTASQMLIDAAFAYFNRDPAQARELASSNLALSRADFLALGGFDREFMISEDRDFCARGLEQGHPLVYAPDAVVDHVRPLTFRTFWRQHFEYGTGAFNFHQRRARRGAAPFRFDRHYYQYLFRYPFGREPRWRALQLSVLLGITQLATAAGLLWEWRRHVARSRRAASRARGRVVGRTRHGS